VGDIEIEGEAEFVAKLADAEKEGDRVLDTVPVGHPEVEKDKEIVEDVDGEELTVDVLTGVPVKTIEADTVVDIVTENDCVEQLELD
jgi:hypothetical protein